MQTEKTTFTDNQLDTWNIDITTADVQRVKKHVMSGGGQPVDLLTIVERGDLSSIQMDCQTLCQIVFWLLFDQITARFSVDAYDAAHAAEYALYPELKNANALQKAANWFGERLGGDQLAAMAEAFEAAIVNFTPPRIRAHLNRVIAKQKELETAILNKAEAEVIRQITDGLGGLSGNVQQSSESIQAGTPLAS